MQTRRTCHMPFFIRLCPSFLSLDDAHTRATKPPLPPARSFPLAGLCVCDNPSHEWTWHYRSLGSAPYSVGLIVSRMFLWAKPSTGQHPHVLFLRATLNTPESVRGDLSACAGPTEMWHTSLLLSLLCTNYFYHYRDQMCEIKFRLFVQLLFLARIHKLQQRFELERQVFPQSSTPCSL